MKFNFVNFVIVTLILLAPEIASAKGGHGAKKAARANSNVTTANNSVTATATRNNYSQTLNTQKGINTINATFTNARGQTVSDAATTVQASNGTISRDIVVQRPNGNVVNEKEILTPNKDGTYNINGTATENYGNVHQYYKTQTINAKEVSLPNAATSLATSDSTLHGKFTGVAGNSSAGSGYSYNSTATNRTSNYNNNAANSFANEPEATTIYNQTLAQSGASVYNTGN